MRFEDIEAGQEIINRYSHETAWVLGKQEGSFTAHYKGGGIVGYLSRSAESFEPAAPPKGADPLADHPAVVKHGYGVSSDDLASFTEALSSLSQARIKGTGREQYSLNQDDNGQQFEHMTSDEMMQGFIEEAADAINYISMAAIKFLSAMRARQGWQ